MKIRRNKEWKNDIKIAVELNYPNKVIEQLKMEKDPIKRNRILITARLALSD